MKTYPLSLSLLALVLAGLGAGRADAELPGTVTGHGLYELKRQPEFLRVQVDVMAKGKDIKEALAKLRARRQAAQKNLESLGVAAGAIEFGDAVVTTEKADRQHMMMRRMMMMQAPGKQAPDRKSVV